MPFELSPAEEMSRKIAQEYTERYIIPRRKELMKDDRAMWEEEAIRQNKFGFHLHIIPRNEGGTGIGYVASMVAIEELCAGWPDLQFVTYGEMAYYFVKATGGEVAKKYTDGIIKGDIKATTVVTEPSGGSDMLGLRSSARKVEGGWILNGRKCFISEAPCTDFIMTLVKTGDPNDPATKGTRSLSAFIVENGMPGYRMGRMENTLGRDGDLAEIIFDNVFVPDSNLVGQVGRGIPPVFSAVADTGRMTIFGMLNGITLGCYRCSVKYAKERKLYGRSISEFQAIQHRIADIAIDLEAARMLCYRAGWLRTKGMKPEGELAIAKYFSTQAAIRASLHAVNIHGAYGVSEDYMPYHYYKHAPLRIGAGGTDELMKNMVAASALADANPDLSAKPAEQSYFGTW
jgi:alkylation response protein AidB-like acyl-CoA dehydrogenase